MSNRPAYIHHVNFPTTDPERTNEWYTKVFGMKYIKPKSNTKVVLMTRGNFDLHFTPVEEMDRMAPYHFAIEVEDWDGFLAHLRRAGRPAHPADHAAGEQLHVLLHPRPRPHDDRAGLPPRRQSRRRWSTPGTEIHLRGARRGLGRRGQAGPGWRAGVRR